MGKSGKKNKSDKINALRKQYDAFLEEDKKRKDRNEYILGRMETMRSCTALIHVRSKAYLKTEGSDYPTQPKYKSTMAHTSNSAIALSGRSNLTLKFTDNNKIIYEPSLLREVSKKYFLIPKVMSNELYSVNYKENDRNQSPTDDIDWRSKYNILEELKREEKADQSDIKYEKQNKKLDGPYENIKNAEYIPLENNKSIIQNNSSVNVELTPIKQQNEMFSSKELSCSNLEVKTNQNKEKQELVPQSNKSHDVILPEHSLLPQVSHNESNLKQDSILMSTNNKIKEIKESNELPEEKLTLEIEPIQALQNNKYLPEDKNCIEFNEDQDNTDQYNLNDARHNLSPIVNNDNTMKVKNENNVFSEKNIENNQETVHNEITVRAQGVYEDVAGHIQDDPAIDITGHQEYQLTESDLNKIQNVKPNVTSEANDELETEQKEMFYGEDNDKNIEYNENDDTAAHPAENENYANPEYSYYDESQKEQIYPTEINEHEESTERYDPNYEQQYVNNYEDTMNAQYQPEQYNDVNSYDQQQQNNYEQQQEHENYQPENPNYEYAPMENVKDAEMNQNAYYTNTEEENAQYEAQQLENSEIVDQQNIAYTTSEDYDDQQEYITMHTEPLQIENVEQQLDIDDGFIPNSIIVAENQDCQEQVIEETTPEIKVT